MTILHGLQFRTGTLLQQFRWYFSKDIEVSLEDNIRDALLKFIQSTLNIDVNMVLTPPFSNLQSDRCKRPFGPPRDSSPWYVMYIQPFGAPSW